MCVYIYIYVLFLFLYFVVLLLCVFSFSMCLCFLFVILLSVFLILLCAFWDSLTPPASIPDRLSSIFLIFVFMFFTEDWEVGVLCVFNLHENFVLGLSPRPPHAKGNMNKSFFSYFCNQNCGRYVF